MAARIARKKPTPKPEPVVEAPIVEETAPPSTLRRLLPACIFVVVLLGMVIAFYNPDHKTTPRPATKTTAPAKNPTSNSAVKAKYDEAKAEFAAWKKKSDVDRDDWLELSQEFYDIYTDAPHWPNRPAALMRAAEVMQYVAEEETSAEDFAIAVGLYKRLAHEFSQSILADDALYAAARIMALQQKKKTEALKILQRLRTTYPKGDMLAAAKKLEASLQEKLRTQKTESKKVPPQKAESKKESIKKEEPKKEAVQVATQKEQKPAPPPPSSLPKVADKGGQTPSPSVIAAPVQKEQVPIPEPTIAYVVPRPPLASVLMLAKKHKILAPQVPQDITLRNVYGFESSSRALPPLPVPKPPVEVAQETQEETQQETKSVALTENSALAQEKAQALVQPLVLPMPKLNDSSMGVPVAVPVAMPTGASAPLLAAPVPDRTAVGRSKNAQMVIALHMPKPMQPVPTGESEKKPLFEKKLLAESMPVILPVTQASPHLPQLAEKPTASQAKTAPELMPYTQEGPPSSVILSPPPVALLPTPTSASQKPAATTEKKQEQKDEPQVVAVAEPTAKQEHSTPEKTLRTPPRLFFTPDLVPDLEPLQWPVLAASVKKPTEEPKVKAPQAEKPIVVATVQKPEPIEAVPPAKLKISHTAFDKTTPDPILTESYTGDIQLVLIPAHKPTSMSMVAVKDAPRPILESDILAAMPKPKHEPMTKPQTSASSLAKATPKPVKTETLQREHKPGSLVALSQQNTPAPKSLPKSVPKPQDEEQSQIIVTPPKAAPEPITVASIQSVSTPKVTPRVVPQSSAPPVTMLEWALNLFTSQDVEPKIAPKATPKPVTPSVTMPVTPPKAAPEPITVASVESVSVPKVTPRVAPQTTAPIVTIPKSAPNLVASHALTPKIAPKATPVPKVTPKPTPVPEQPPVLSAQDLDQRVKEAKGNDMAAQLGLSIRTVYVDIGHGGRDPGTMHNGLVERDVVLDIGKRVGKLLIAQGFNVVYSRTTDVTVALSSRPKNANEVGADLFVSIHMNAFTNVSVSGFETYYLDFSRNSEASRVATLENSVSDKTLGDLQDVVAKMLLNVRTKESIGLARSIQKATVRTARKQGFATKDGGTRSAPFHVLIGTSMPAVLVEIGYCTNKKEAQLLKRSDYRTALAQGIVQGIVVYQKELEKKTDEHFALTQNP